MLTTAQELFWQIVEPSNSFVTLSRSWFLQSLRFCLKSRDWRWSSTRYYESNGQVIDPLHPLITPLPAEFWWGG